MKNSNPSHVWKLLTAILILGSLSSCEVSHSLVQQAAPPTSLFQIGVPQEGGAVVHGRAIYTITNEQPTAFMKLVNKILPMAYAANGSTTVTYTNAASTNFPIDVTGFAPSGFSGIE